MLADLFFGRRKDLVGRARGILAVIGLTGLLARGGYLSLDAYLASTWPYRLLIAAALLIPALLFGAVAWEDRGRVVRDAEQDAQRTVTIFCQHALNVFETHELIAARINERHRQLGAGLGGEGRDG